MFISILQHEAHQRSDVVDFELPENVLPVRVHGVHAQEQVLGDHAVGAAHAYIMGDFLLALGQEVWVHGIPGFRFRDKSGVHAWPLQ